MEGALIARDRVGVQDFVLLDSHMSESAFLDNLCKRYRENLIYTYIGTLLVSVNPYKELDIYTMKQMEQYKGVNFFELPPHIYAIADNTYRLMCSEYNDHFILISGESGAGKTEASKKILQFFAMTCPTTEQLQVVRDRLLLSNPVLEAFGNAKTLRNDNSSRFGKYMDIQFDFKGAPVGGHILSYLIEKSRVVHQNPGERNFHVFYQLLEGGEEELLEGLGLEGSPQKYSYLVQGGCAKVSSINDKSDWRTVQKAFVVIDFAPRDIENLLGIIASVLHLGNIQFEEDSNGHAIITNTNGTQLHWISKLLGVHLSILQESLTHRKIEARFEEVLSPLDVDLAFYARDAVAKAIYGRTFTWLVNKINTSLANRDFSRKTVIGLLDIYGFEVFETNSFEQFCINYCNEKLHQLLIEMTLKAEQEEYELEGIEWEPVPYFNNKIICDLVEEKHKGIISILDEECLRPGEATDLSFLEKLEEKVGDHAHFVTRKLADQKTRKSIDWVDFRLLHYAGEVTYCTVGFLEKNNDLLYRNLKEVLCNSKNGILKECFCPSELHNRRRPETVATQFKTSLSSLIDILMSKEPSYIRCIKPNGEKEPDKFDESLIRHQVKYLGLMEHLRVRRAGFAYRRKYEHFLQRYKSLCPDTWPQWRGPAAKGVEKLIHHIGYKPEEYKMGRTKLFIRFPRTLFATEDAFEYRKHLLISRIQAKFRGCLGKREFQKMRQAAILLEAAWRGVLARRLAKKRMWAVETIHKFLKGFIHRTEPLNSSNVDFVRFVQYAYLVKLRDHIPKTVLDKSWLKPPEIMQQTSALLKTICKRNLVRKYCCGITAEKKAQMEQKAVASAIFSGRKVGYVESLNELFVDSRLSCSVAFRNSNIGLELYVLYYKTTLEEPLNEITKGKKIKAFLACQKFLRRPQKSFLPPSLPGESELCPKVLQMIRHEKVQYVTPVVKYDRNGFKPRERLLVLTRLAAYVVETAKIKQKIEYATLRGISTSSLSDGILVLHVPEDHKQEKGDAILWCKHVFEAVTKLCMLAKKQDLVAVVQGSLQFQISPGKEGTMVFTTGQEPHIYKAKNGQLTVVSLWRANIQGALVPPGKCEYYFPP
ncbi:unconventional myosin-Ih isoform X3 [Crotalus tigris]|nr:unconventional myosin-Ih isoform X3 [Crotalus tigris]